MLAVGGKRGIGQAAPAIVLEAALEKQYGDSTTYLATARYKYEFRGRSYEGHRIGFTERFDNVGSWQQERYSELNAARRSSVAIEVWVNPEDPREAIVDRELRWSIIAFSIPFATLFPAVALGALWVFVRVWSTPAGAQVELRGNPSSITSGARSGAIALWVVASFWNLMAFPIAFLFIHQEFGRSWIWLLILLFPLVGIGLLWAAISRTIQLVRHGPVNISLQPEQSRLGEPIVVQASFGGTPPAGTYVLSLVCQLVDSRGEGVDEKTVWRQEREVPIYGLAASTTFSAPANLPPSQPHSDLHHRWRVQLSFPGGKDVRDFDIAIAAAREGAVMLEALDANDQDSSIAPARTIPRSVATVRDTSNEVAIEYHPENQRGTAIGTFIVGVVFAAACGFLVFGPPSGATPVFIGSIFGAVAIALFAAAVYAFTHRRTVAVSGGIVEVKEAWWFGAKHFRFGAASVRDLKTTISGMSTVGTKRYDHHRIAMRLNGGREIVVASNVRDAGVAEALQRLLRRHVNGQANVAIAAVDAATFIAAKPPHIDIDPKKLKNRIHLGLKLLAAVGFFALVWDFVSPFIASRQRPEPASLEVEAPRKSALSDPNRALFAAIANDRSAELKAALAAGADVNATNEWGATPLIVAAGAGSVLTVVLLIEAGADVNFGVSKHSDRRGRTALMQAATGQRGAVVGELLRAGANPEAFDAQGWSVLHYAARHGDLGTLRAARNLRISMDLRSPQGRGETPLMIAARFGRVDSIDQLIDLGADPRATDSHGENAYGWAKFFNQRAAMDALREYR